MTRHSRTIVSINLGQAKSVEYHQKTITTGIYKQPVSERVYAGIEGLEGDTQVDRKNHGGPDKAIYVYTLENYRYWENYLGSDPYPYGQFGENLTVTGLLDEQVFIGDIWQIGNVVTQVTQPRVPCFKLGLRMENAGFVEDFLMSGRVGFYLRVLETGYVQNGDILQRLELGYSSLSVHEAMQALIKGPRQQAIIQQALSIPALSAAWREDLEQRLLRMQ